MTAAAFTNSYIILGAWMDGWMDKDRRRRKFVPKSDSELPN